MGIEIPIPDNYKPSKVNKLSAAEREKMNRLLASNSLTKGWLKNKSYKKQCNAKEVSLELQQKYQETVYPVCPALRKMIKQEKHYILPDIPKTNLPLLDSIIKILVVFAGIIELKPDEETVVRWAHSENLLTERLNLIRNDLLALPQSLEKDFPETAKECKELIAELKLAEWRYSMHGQSLVYLLPNHLEFGNWATFLEWREQQGNRASDKIEMCRLTRHYPAEAIKVMRSLSIILSPLASKILPEQALESNRRSTELKQILDEHSNRNITADLASGGKVGGTTQPTPKTDTTLIYLSEAAEFYNIPKSTLSKAAAKSPGEQGYLWSGRKGRRVFLRKNDCQKLAQSRTKLRNI